MLRSMLALTILGWPAVSQEPPLVSPPKIVSKQEAEYSEEARRAKICGTVLLNLVVEPDGTPNNVNVERALGYGLDENALRAVRTWRFQPGMKDGQPVAVSAHVEVNYRMIGCQPQQAQRRPPAPDPGTAPQSADEAYRRAMQAIRNHRFEDAIRLLDNAVRMRPEWPQAWASRGRAKLMAKRYDDAITDLDKALELDPSAAPLYDQRGLAYSYSNRHERALIDYSKAIDLNPKAPMFYNNRGWAYLELGRPSDALPDLDRAIEMRPDLEKALENRGNVYMQLHDYTRAIADFTAAIEVRPTRWDYERRAEAKRAEGDIAGADADLAAAANMPAAATPETRRIVIAAEAMAANLVRKVDPEIPPLAKQAKISGIVRFRVTVGTDGSVRDVQLISGHPLLISAAENAVRQWVYKPVTVGSEKVEAVSTVDVPFGGSQRP
jgi:TonB family protein